MLGHGKMVLDPFHLVAIAPMPPIIDDEFDSLVHREYEGLCRYAWRIVHNPEDAAEIVQETFLRFHRMRAKEKTLEKDPVRVLLYRMAHNLAIDYVRRRVTRKRYEKLNARVRIMPARESFEGELLADERYGQLRDALRRLKPREAECLALKSEGHSYEDIAMILNIHSDSVGPTVSRALRRLRVAYLELTRSRRCVNESGPTAQTADKTALNHPLQQQRSATRFGTRR